MPPLLHPSLVNGRFGDPAVYVETQFEKGTILFDLGDISVLPPRKVHRLEQVFVSNSRTALLSILFRNTRNREHLSYLIGLRQG